ncbi:hypothetical protein C8N40_101521 [Pontibacter mucosus]|uniref:Uncharacterized protein n=1 Tax=Pontibacter mucosus TaxID=1649266 RepID=A0A2T5YTQ4_9BACT|nr:hypothetical protein [Pontibacter mucosus]PTX22693.1 hypothetical protein C8N40_101521 [Pontibacter mucosus]
MIAVSNNQYYGLNYDRTKNRVYLRINHYWKSPEVVPTYLSDWDQVIELAKPGFTLLADFRNMLTHPTSVKELHEAVANRLAESNISYVAEVSPTDRIAVLQVSGVWKQIGKGSIKVADIVLGENILDQLANAEE